MANIKEEIIIEKSDAVDIHVALSEYRDRWGVDIREFINSDRYTGPTKKGIYIPVEKLKEIRSAIDKIFEIIKKEGIE